MPTRCDRQSLCSGVFKILKSGIFSGDSNCQYKDVESNGLLLKSNPPIILIYLGGPDPFLSLAHEVAHLRLGIENGPDLEKEAKANLEEYQSQKEKEARVSAEKTHIRLAGLVWT